MHRATRTLIRYDKFDEGQNQEKCAAQHEERERPTARDSVDVLIQVQTMNGITDEE